MAFLPKYRGTIRNPNKRRSNKVPEKTKKRIENTLNKKAVNARIAKLIGMIMQSEADEMNGYCPSYDNIRKKKFETNWCDTHSCDQCKRIALNQEKQRMIDEYIFK